MTTGVRILVIGGIVIAVGVGVYFIVKPRKENVPAGTPASFPLYPGMTGALITNLQKGLNQYVNVLINVTGTFDAATVTALKTAIDTSPPVTEAQYNEIIAPPDGTNSQTYSPQQQSTTTPDFHPATAMGNPPATPYIPV